MSRPFEPLIKANFFTPEELELMWCEFKVLTRPEVMLKPTDTGGSYTDGVLMKNNRGIFFDQFYLDMTKSPTFNAALKIFEGVTAEFADLCFVNSLVLQTKKSNMLLSYYEDSDFYLPHRDHSITTVLYWFCQEPKAFTGGDLHFPEIDLTVPFENNMMVMFPSVAIHEVSAVKMNSNTPPYSGRFAVTHFLTL